MGRNREIVLFHLDCGHITSLSEDDKKAILRAADPLIATGGRTMLTKILKGSKDKKLLEHSLEDCPAYGYYNSLTLQEISYRVDWMIKQDYLEIEYSGRLPVLVYSAKGWEIERETYAEELLEKLTTLLKWGNYSFVHELKDRNRGMILLLIEKIRKTGNPKFIPLLRAWKEIDYKKVQAELQRVIDFLEEVP
jgi:hypothetical protein